MATSDPLSGPQRRALLGALAPFAGQIERVDVYGSRAQGTHRPGSDIDLILVGDLDLATLVAVQLAVEASDLSIAADIVRETDLIDPVLREESLRAARTLFTHDQLRAALAA